MAAITYDSREILRNFADAYDIKFPLLADVGSNVIRAFGIFNTNIPEDVKPMYGMAWPGNYLLSPSGVVLDKKFLPNYEHRVSASEIVLRYFGKRGTNAVEIDAGVVKAVITLSTDSCFPGQELGLALDLSIEPGWHVYGSPVPAGYQALELKLRSPLIADQSLALPNPMRMELKALGETLPVYVGGFRATGRLFIKWSPPAPAPFMLALADVITPGLYKIEGALCLQACSDEICEPSQILQFSLPLTINTGIPAVPNKTSER